VPVKVTGADVVQGNFKQYAVQYRAQIRFTLSRESEIVEQRLKQEHPWQNRTGRAERGLHAGVIEETSGLFSLRASHGPDVYYGVYLETMQQGRFAVLWPVIRTQWPKTRARCAAAVRKINLKGGGA
jgi:hypothetical protein